MAETLDAGHGIAAAAHRRRATRCYGLRHALRARGETVVLEDAHRPVPENGPRPRALPGKRLSGPRADVQHHQVGWHLVRVHGDDSLRLIEAVGADTVHGQ